MDKLKILIAEHSVLYRKHITDLVDSTEYGKVIHTASNSQIALEWLEQDSTDVFLLDSYLLLECGVDVITKIRMKHPLLEIIMMSDKDPAYSAITLDALNLGAMDFFIKPDIDGMQLSSTIKNKLDAIFAQIKVRRFLPHHSAFKNISLRPVGNDDSSIVTPIVKARSKHLVGTIDLVVIASSTGGPVALDVVCRHLPVNFNKPVLVVQHMPPGFTKVLADALDKKCHMHIREAENGDQVIAGQMMIAPGGFHMELEQTDNIKTNVKLTDTPYVNGVKPAADILFRSVSDLYRGKNILAVVMTGMGNDGLNGIRALKESSNCYCITQSENTCVVYGMPKCVDDAHLSDESVDLADIANRMSQICLGGL